MDLSTITVNDFKAYFLRDFPYPPSSPTPDTLNPNYVQDGDINRAFGEAQMNFNQALFGSDQNITIAYMYITAHYLVNDLRAAAGGVEGTPSFPVSSRSVGSVSEAYVVPDRYKDDAVLSFYTTTPYGLKYLSLVLPGLAGNFHVSLGRTLP